MLVAHKWQYTIHEQISSFFIDKNCSLLTASCCLLYYDTLHWQERVSQTCVHIMTLCGVLLYHLGMYDYRQHNIVFT